MTNRASSILPHREQVRRLESYAISKRLIKRPGRGEEGRRLERKMVGRTTTELVSLAS